MLVLSASGVRAETTAYGEAFDSLYRINLASHTASLIGPAGSYGGQVIANISGLSYSPDGELYAVAGGANALIRIDSSDGGATVVGSFGLNGQGDPQRNDALDLAMTFACDGTLYLVSAYAGKLWTVNPSTGATTLVGATGATITGLVAAGDTLLGAGGRGDDRLYRLNTRTGAATAIGSYGSGVTTWVNSVSMSFDDSGRLWAVLNYVPPAPGSTSVPEWSDLARIDPFTGHVTNLGPITGPASLEQVGMKGFAVGPPPCGAGLGAPVAAPVGSPGWLAGLAALLVAAAGWTKHRRPFDRV
jgi:Repeat of unknown function (DUF6923)